VAFPFVTACAGTYGALPTLVDAPAVSLWKYGFLTVASIIDDPDDHERNGIAYKAMACVANVLPIVDDCVTPPTKVPTDTLVKEQNIVRGCPFNLYAALSCKTTNLEAMRGEVSEVFRLGEQGALEGQIWTNVLATTTSVVLNASSLPADAFTPVGSISALESAIAACYGGRATIHADRGIAAYLLRDRQVEIVDDHFETPLGTKVGFYGGGLNTSPVGVAAPDGYAWIYITPEVTLRRFEPIVLPEDAGHMLQYTASMTNEPYVLAERTYVASTECCRFAVLACLSC
jgi:hypothetical protein